MNYRKISSEEISILENQFCRAENWSDIEVTETFTTDNIRNVSFIGSCTLGNYSRRIETESKKVVKCGLYDSTIDGCNLSDDILIRNVQKLSNYNIESDVIIEHVNELTVHGESTFGNGHEIDVLNEGGGRELPIYDQLSSQMAYLIVTARHDADLVQVLKKSISKYTDEIRSSNGTIKAGSRISNCNTIEDVNIGPHVSVKGIQLLENGSIIGEKDTETRVGSGVIARDFIIQSGSSVDSCAMIEGTFIGQGVQIGKQFSAENSVFFANSEGFHGEAVSLFAGPYTVTHHKSTLMIAEMCSFYNAGSGTNQSNHMYKLGPLHQGILERGSKTGSFAYLLWPCKVGPFSVVMGKHGGNFDTSNLPFSYLTVEDEKSYLTPAMNLITVGTRRDSVKWPNRDRRKGAQKLDLIHFELFNPFVIEKILNGIDILTGLYEKTPKERDVVSYNGVRIKRLMLKSCRKYYEMALHIFVGNQILARLESMETWSSVKDTQMALNAKDKAKDYKWADLTGLITPVSELENVISTLTALQSPGLSDAEDLLQSLYDNYEDYKWNYTVHVLNERFDIVVDDITKENLIEIISKWKENSMRLNNMILMDAKKEFDANSMIGFGLDGDDEVRQNDFKSVRGSYDENSFVTGLMEENSKIEKTADHIIQKIEKLH
jgi:hypothetical protein